MATHEEIILLMQRGAVVMLKLETQEESYAHTKEQIEAIEARVRMEVLMESNSKKDSD